MSDTDTRLAALASMPKAYTNEEYAAHRQVWFAALRSGDYNQGTTRLVSLVYPDSVSVGVPHYCCLGVACVLAGVPADDLSSGFYGIDTHYSLPSLKLSNSYSTPEVTRWLGLSTEDGKFSNVQFAASSGSLDNANSLAQLNDRFKWTFVQIAQFAEFHAQDLWAPGTF